MGRLDSHPAATLLQTEIACRSRPACASWIATVILTGSSSAPRPAAISRVTWSKSVGAEELRRCVLLEGVYGITSERPLMEQLEYNLLYRWVVGLWAGDLVREPTVLPKNRAGLQSGEVFAKFMTKLLNHPQVK